MCRLSGTRKRQRSKCYIGNRTEGKTVTTTAPVAIKDNPPRPTVQIKNPLYFFLLIFQRVWQTVRRLSGVTKARWLSPEHSQTPCTSTSTLNGPAPQIKQGPKLSPTMTDTATTPDHDGANNNSVTECNPSVDVGSSTPKLSIQIPGAAASSTGGKAGWCSPSNKTRQYVLFRSHPCSGNNILFSTLCAHRWLKQIKSNGSKEDFNTYYQTLSAESKAVRVF